MGIRLFSDILILSFDHPFLRGIPGIIERMKNEEKQSLSRELEIGGVWYLQSVFPVEGEGVRVYSVDITERKHFEQALKANERELRTVVEGSPIPQFVLDKDHRVIFWNRALEEYTSLPASRMVGTREHCSGFYNYQRPCLADLILDNNVQDVSKWYPGKFSRSSLVGDALEAVDFFPRMREHGTWMHFTAAPIRDAGGNIIGAVETLEDITEQKKAEQTLKASEELFRTVANYVYDWEYFLDTSKRLVYTTPSCSRFTGYAPEEFYANPGLLQKIVHPDDRKRFLDHLTMVSEHDKEATLDLRIINKDGGELWINHICHPVFDESGVYMGRRISNTDISRQKRLEERLGECERQTRLAGTKS
jgi:PAS domain S-box-containing protein